MMENFDSNLLSLLDEKFVSSYFGGPYWSRCDYEIKKRSIRYDDKPLVFTLSGERICQSGIVGNHKKYPYEYISVSFSSLDSNFFTLSNDILNEIKFIYPDILVHYLQTKTIKIVLPSFARFHRNHQIVEKPPLGTKFKINSMRIGFSQIRFKYCDGYLQNKELELLAYEIYLD